MRWVGGTPSDLLKVHYSEIYDLRHEGEIKASIGRRPLTGLYAVFIHGKYAEFKTLAQARNYAENIILEDILCNG